LEKERGIALKGMDWIWMSALMTVTGFVLLRIVGRKSISQMTIPTTVIMISIGSIIIQPFVEKSIWKTIGSAFVIVMMLKLVEYLQMKFQWMENLMSGKALPVIEDGKLNVKNLKKLRMTVDQLEMRLRQQGHGQMADIEVATLEPNGQLGLVPKPEFRPLTVIELKKALEDYFGAGMQPSGGSASKNANHPPLFQETVEDGHSKKIDPKLQ
jgi:uncharacterized membrane protein YcaP (DUF421 family)